MSAVYRKDEVPRKERIGSFLEERTKKASHAVKGRYGDSQGPSKGRAATDQTRSKSGFLTRN